MTDITKFDSVADALSSLPDDPSPNGMYPTQADVTKFDSVAEAIASLPDKEMPSVSSVGKAIVSDVGSFFSDIGKGINIAAENVPITGPDDRFLPIDVRRQLQEEQWRRAQRTPLEKRTEIAESASGQAIDTAKKYYQDMLLSIPSSERESLAMKAVQFGASAATGMAGGPLAPFLFAAREMGSVWDRVYEDEISKKKSPEEAAATASQKAWISGTKEGLAWMLGPKAFRSFVTKWISKYASPYAGTVGRAALGAVSGGVEIGGTAGISQLSQNIIEGKPVTEGVGAAVLGSGVVGGAMGGWSGAAHPESHVARIAESKGLTPEEYVGQIRKEVSDRVDKLQGGLEPAAQSVLEKFKFKVNAVGEDHPVFANNPNALFVEYGGEIYMNQRRAMTMWHLMRGRNQSKWFGDVLEEEFIHTQQNEPGIGEAWLGTLSPAEKLLGNRLIRRKWSGTQTRFGREMSDEEFGKEFMRWRIARLEGKSAPEIAEEAGMEKWTLQSLDMIDRLLEKLSKRKGQDDDYLNNVRVGMYYARLAIEKPEEPSGISEGTRELAKTIRGSMDARNAANRKAMLDRIREQSKQRSQSLMDAPAMPQTLFQAEQQVNQQSKEPDAAGMDKLAQRIKYHKDSTGALDISDLNVDFPGLENLSDERRRDVGKEPLSKDEITKILAGWGVGLKQSQSEPPIPSDQKDNQSHRLYMLTAAKAGKLRKAAEAEKDPVRKQELLDQVGVLQQNADIYGEEANMGMPEGTKQMLRDKASEFEKMGKVEDAAKANAAADIADADLMNLGRRKAKKPSAEEKVSAPESGDISSVIWDENKGGLYKLREYTGKVKQGGVIKGEDGVSFLVSGKDPVAFQFDPKKFTKEKAEEWIQNFLGMVDDAKSDAMYHESDITSDREKNDRLRDSISTEIVGLRQEADRYDQNGDHESAREMRNHAEWLRTKMPPFQFHESDLLMERAGAGDEDALREVRSKLMESGMSDYELQRLQDVSRIESNLKSAKRKREQWRQAMADADRMMIESDKLKESRKPKAAADLANQARALRNSVAMNMSESDTLLRESENLKRKHPDWEKKKPGTMKRTEKNVSAAARGFFSNISDWTIGKFKSSMFPVFGEMSDPELQNHYNAALTEKLNLNLDGKDPTGEELTKILTAYNLERKMRGEASAIGRYLGKEFRIPDAKPVLSKMDAWRQGFQGVVDFTVEKSAKADTDLKNAQQDLENFDSRMALSNLNDQQRVSRSKLLEAQAIGKLSARDADRLSEYESLMRSRQPEMTEEQQQARKRLVERVMASDIAAKQSQMWVATARDHMLNTTSDQVPKEFSTDTSLDISSDERLRIIAKSLIWEEALSDPTKFITDVSYNDMDWEGSELPCWINCENHILTPATWNRVVEGTGVAKKKQLKKIVVNVQDPLDKERTIKARVVIGSKGDILPSDATRAFVVIMNRAGESVLGGKKMPVRDRKVYLVSAYRDASSGKVMVRDPEYTPGTQRVVSGGAVIGSGEKAVRYGAKASGAKKGQYASAEDIESRYVMLDFGRTISPHKGMVKKWESYESYMSEIGERARVTMEQRYGPDYFDPFWTLRKLSDNVNHDHDMTPEERVRYLEEGWNERRLIKDPGDIEGTAGIRTRYYNAMKQHMDVMNAMMGSRTSAANDLTYDDALAIWRLLEGVVDSAGVDQAMRDADRRDPTHTDPRNRRAYMAMRKIARRIMDEGILDFDPMKVKETSGVTAEQMMDYENQLIAEHYADPGTQSDLVELLGPRSPGQIFKAHILYEELLTRIRQIAIDTGDAWRFVSETIQRFSEPAPKPPPLGPTEKQFKALLEWDREQKQQQTEWWMDKLTGPGRKFDPVWLTPQSPAGLQLGREARRSEIKPYQVEGNVNIGSEEAAMVKAKLKGEFRLPSPTDPWKARNFKRLMEDVLGRPIASAKELYDLGQRIYWPAQSAIYHESDLMGSFGRFADDVTRLENSNLKSGPAGSGSLGDEARKLRTYAQELTKGEVKNRVASALADKMDFLKKMDQQGVKSPKDLYKVEKARVSLDLINNDSRKMVGRVRKDIGKAEVSLAEAVRDAIGKDLPNALRSLSHAERSLVQAPDVVADFLDNMAGGNGFVTKHFIDTLDRGYNNAMVRYGGMWDGMKEVAKQHGSLSKREKMDLRIYEVAVQEGGIEKLGASGVSPDRIKEVIDAGLNPKQMAYYQHARKVRDELFEPMSQVAKELYGIEVKYRKNYAPMPGDPDQAPIPDMGRRVSSGEAVDFDEFNSFSRLDIPWDPPVGTKTKQWFTKERKPKARRGVELDFMKSFDQWARDVSHFIEMQRDLKMLGEVTRQPWFTEKYGDLGQKWAADRLDVVAKMSYERMGEFQRMLMWLKNNTSVGIVAARLISQTKHAPNVAFTVRALGPEWVAFGSKHAFTPEGQEFIKKNMYEVYRRYGGEEAIQSLMGGGKIRRAQAATFFIERGIDSADARTAALGMYGKILEKKGINPDDFAEFPVDDEARGFAIRIARQAVASPLIKDQPHFISRSKVPAATKLATQFQSTMLRQYSYLRHDIMDYALTGDPKKMGSSFLSAMAMMAMLAGEAAIVRGAISMYGSKKRRDEIKEKEGWASTMFHELLRRVPGVGQLSAWINYGETGVPTLDTAIDAAKGARGYMSGVGPHNVPLSAGGVDRARGQMIGAAASLAGVPGVSVYQQIKQNRPEWFQQSPLEEMSQKARNFVSDKKLRRNMGWAWVPEGGDSEREMIELARRGDMAKAKKMLAELLKQKKPDGTLVNRGDVLRALDHWAKRPLTGSPQSEDLFLRSLSVSDRIKLSKAKAEKRAIAGKLTQAIAASD